MIVSCAYCGPLPSADLENLMGRAWGKHVVQCHPEWPVEVTVAEDSRWAAHIDGRLSLTHEDKAEIDAAYEESARCQRESWAAAQADTVGGTHIDGDPRG